MIKAVYVGYVWDRDRGEKVAVCVASSKKRAGELIEEWIAEFDPKKIDYISGAVVSLLDSKYIDLSKGDRA